MKKVARDRLCDPPANRGLTVANAGHAKAWSHARSDGIPYERTTLMPSPRVNKRLVPALPPVSPEVHGEALKRANALAEGLFPHQVEGLAFLLGRRRAILADDMG